MKKNKQGIVLINVLIFAAIAITVTTALVNWGALVLKTTRTLGVREQAFQIAEAGIEYYRWHLAHAPTDYKDGTGADGPYVHDFEDALGNVIGQFSLTITPPVSGSTLVKIVSKGTVTADAGVSRSIQAILAIPSLAKFAVVANDNMRFGSGTEVFGPIHVNGGVRFDGLAHNIVTSAQSTYDDPDDVSTQHKFAVYTTLSPADPNPPATIPNRPDVFVAGRQFPVQPFDFVGLTADLASLKSLAQSGGRYISASGASGYHIVLKTDDTFDLFKVNTIQAPPKKCDNQNNQNGWGTWSIGSEQFVANYPYPSNGIVFVEDDVWMSGQINGARLTIAAGQFPDNVTTRRSITVNNDILYSNYDGNDVLALIAQKNINAGLASENDLRIDAALIAQTGRVGRFYYENSCGTGYTRNSITLYGMIATNVRYGFAYTDGTGYETRNIIYDGNLLYGPPPSFPLTSNQYQTISWEEVK